MTIFDVLFQLSTVYLITVGIFYYFFYVCCEESKKEPFNSPIVLFWDNILKNPYIKLLIHMQLEKELILNQIRIKYPVLFNNT